MQREQSNHSKVCWTTFAGFCWTPLQSLLVAHANFADPSKCFQRGWNKKDLVFGVCKAVIPLAPARPQSKHAHERCLIQVWTGFAGRIGFPVRLVLKSLRSPLSLFPAIYCEGEPDDGRRKGIS
jgi:hypothetical protein